jgi:hypothetical protein
MIYCGPMQRQVTENQALWAIIAVMIGIDALWAWSAGIRVSPSLWIIVVFCGMACLNLVYATIRPDRRIGMFAATIAQLIAFSSASMLLTYLSATSKFPLIDGYLAAADAAIGFDWLSLFMWVHGHPAVDRLLAISYDSGIIQIIILVILLPALGQLDRLREFVWLFVITLLITVALAWVMPAEGAFGYYRVSHLTNAYYLHDFNALRAGAMPEIAMARLTGIVQFPSFHAAMALMLIYAYRGISYLFPISILLNLVMIASTPTTGGHHLMDVLAGLAVVPLAIFILRSWQREPSERLVVAVDSMSSMRD